MKPFNLEEALAGKPVVTRDGLKVTEIYHFKTGTSAYSVHACIDGRIKEYTQRGTYYEKLNGSDFDLFMEEPIIEGWVNVYCVNDNYIYISSTHESAEKAIESSKHSGDAKYYIKTIKIDNQPE